MENIITRNFEKKDYDKVLELNDESVHFLSQLTNDGLNNFIAQAAIFNVIEVDGVVEGFIFALREGKEYDSLNYVWFLNHYNQFLYIDRIVISLKMQNKGLGKMLYQSLFNFAKLSDVPYVTAEIDIDPPNPGSLIFHEKFGFKEVGVQAVAEGKKVVSLQILKLT